MSGAGAGGAAAAAGAGGASAGGGAGAGPPVAGWIDSDWLEEQCEECVCGLCFGVMQEPASGCSEGHSFCRGCFGKALVEQKKCPACRRPVSDESKLVRNRPLEGIIAKLRVEHGAEQGKGAAAPPAAKRAKLAPAASMKVDALKEELRQRGLEIAGNKPVLVARLEGDRKKDGGCRWKASVGELAAHLGECQWTSVKCPNEGCTESPLRMDLAHHDATCGRLQVPCGNGCRKQVERRSLAEHDEVCPLVDIDCPNEGCSVQDARCTMRYHREKCEHEEVTCLCPGCDARLLRKGMDAHVEATHLRHQSATRQLQGMWQENAALRAVSESELRLAAPSPTSWVFNWRADGWEIAGWDAFFRSETHAFGGGVSGRCVLVVDKTDSQYIAFEPKGIDKCRVHATFSILDKNDKILRQVSEIGSDDAPTDQEIKGVLFSVTVAEKAQSVRADGSIRVRAVVRLFLDDAA